MRAEDALLQAKSYVKKSLEGAGALKGTPGKDGISPVIEVSKSGKVTTITITDVEGTKIVEINDGKDGSAEAESNTTPISQGVDDIDVIPDKYNTGANETVTYEEISAAGKTSNGVNFSAHTSGTGLKLDFTYSNRSFSSASEIAFENVDFQTIVYMTGEALADGDTPKTLKFNNCKFTRYSASKTGVGNVSYEFNNCTFVGGFSGSNATLKNCRLGGTDGDALVLYQNVTVDSCYIADMAHYNSGGSHTDGLQIYGTSGYDAGNILVQNCRFEMPAYPITQDGTANASYVNACLFVGLEYSSGDNITIKDCVMNGGGKMIYCDAADGLTLTNVTIDNIRAGYSHRYGLGVSESINTDTIQADITSVAHYDALLCSSVWKEENGDVKIIVSNDTSIERTLRIYYTDKDYIEHTIEGVPAYNDIVADSMTFEDFPFDLEYTVTGDPDFVVVYDVTDEENIKQIRFVNFTDDDVCIGEKTIDVYQKLLELEARIAALET